MFTTSLILFLFSSVFVLVWAARRGGPPAAATALFGVLVAGGLTGLASPVVPLPTLFLLGAALNVSGYALFRRAGRHWPAGLVNFLVIAILSTVVPFGILEWASRALTEAKLVRFYEPLQVVAANHEDWRLFHVTTNQGVEADPILFWQPRAFYPFNHQRMRGPAVEIPKPPGVYRIMTYGDSNTDGPPAGGAWPQRLGELLKPETVGGKRIEVINAGVTGYSSYQGLMRFRQQLSDFRPDLILVSFGWNDASPALGKPDREFTPPNPTSANLLRNLYRYRFFWC